MTFQDRLNPAVAFEQRVIERLNATGWEALPFGQGQLPEKCRRNLMRFEDGSRRPSLIRWMPDIITFREFSKERVWVSLIDAKVCGGNTDNYSLEISAIETATIYTDHLYTPTFFVFDDFRVLTPRDARQRGFQIPDTGRNHGSGTPFLLIKKRWGRSFDEIFTPVVAHQ